MRARLVVIGIFAIKSLFEGANAFAQRVSQLRKTLVTKEQNDNRKNEKVSEAESKHRWNPTPGAGGGKTDSELRDRAWLLWNTGSGLLIFE